MQCSTYVRVCSGASQDPAWLLVFGRGQWVWPDDGSWRLLDGTCTFLLSEVALADLNVKNGNAHGIDILPKAIELARQSAQGLIARGVAVHNVTFEQRNVFVPDKENRKWDRIHVGAACSHKKKFCLYDLLKPGGILVMPIGEHMVMAKKDRNGMTREVKLLVGFLSSKQPDYF